MEKRKIIIGDYDTSAYGWTLTGWQLSAATQKTNFVDKPAGDGAWDLSTALTDGIPRYSDRELVATFECSEWDRMNRERVIRDMINRLDGLRVTIKLPDDDFYHITGRIHLAKDYNDPAHASVTLTAVCEPWKYADVETITAVTATSTKKIVTLVNHGRKTLVPVLTVSGTGASILLEFGSSSTALGPGAHQWPSLQLSPGSHGLTVSGSGSLIVSYREAVLE
jgi:hypothetical protein